MLRNLHSMTFLLAIIFATTCGSSLSLAASTDKTLVAWVQPSTLDQKGGSVLTLQDGRYFDGIVFAELAPQKWMVGSSNYKRTNREQKDYPAETALAKQPYQMALVSKGDQIAIYKDGKEIDSYTTQNLQLLNNPNSLLVLGIRHLGQGSGSFVGAIDDARVYPQALTAEQLKALTPNQLKEGGPRPVACFDFEGKDVKVATDKMRTFKATRLEGSAKIADGKLVLGSGGHLVAAKSADALKASKNIGGSGARQMVKDPNYVPETPQFPAEIPQNWPSYHIFHPSFTHGSPFDPNAAIYYKGKYHLHYIYKNDTGFCFAHISSPDMLHWKWHPTVLSPATTGHGMFSGTAFLTKDGKVANTYCGWGSNRNQIAYALDDNLDKWSDTWVMLPRDKDGKLMTDQPYFDPDIWIMDGKYYGLNGVGSSKPPTIMKSDDLKEWEFIGEFLHPDFDEEKLGTSKKDDISCANVFKLGDKWVMLCINHKKGCRYFIGDFVNEQFLPESHGMMSFGGRQVFAPESLLTKDGRRVMWAWFMGGPVKAIQTLPRELDLAKDGTLIIRPLRELATLRTDEGKASDVTVKQGSPKLVSDVLKGGVRGDRQELEIVLDYDQVKNFELNVLCNEKTENGLPIRVDLEAGLLKVGNREAPLKIKKGEPLTLRVFLDATLVEVYANDRQAVMIEKNRSAKPGEDDRVALIATEGDVKVKNLAAWRMKSTYPKGAAPSK